MKRRIFALMGTILLIAVLGILFREPRTDRNWSEEFSRTSTATSTSSGTVVISNVRDWTYGLGTTTSTKWTSVEVDPAKITQAWFITEPFTSWKAVGHTFLTFEFADGTALSFSVEAKRQQGQGYSAFLGLFNQYELAYQWGTERDFVTRRLLYLEHPVRRYPLAVSPAMAQALFRGVIAQTNELALHPRFYNTLTENCTNVLAYITNKTVPHSLPYDISWNLTGYADLYLMRQGLIKEVASSTEVTRATFDLTPHREQIAGAATYDPVSFTALLNRFAGL